MTEGDRAAAIEAAAAEVRRDTVEALRGRSDPARCESLCRSLVGRIDAEFAALAADGAPLACAAGCSFCCHLRVGVLPHEAIALVNHLRTGVAPDVAATIEARLVANARTLAGMTVAEHYGANLGCALLVGGRCAAYEVRPSACASYHSTSRARCEQSYRHPEHAGTPRNSRPALAELRAFTAAAVEATEAGLADAGLATRRGELHQLTARILEDPRVAARWYAGAEIAAD